MNKRLLTLAFYMVLTSLWFSPPLFADENLDADKVIETLQQTLLESMQAGNSLSYTDRYDRLAPVITAYFDTKLMARVILGRYWKKLDENNQVQFTDIFKQLSIATYASRFDSYNNESFEYLETRPLKKGRLVLKTRLNKIDGEPVSLDYLMHENEGQWKIISVIADGVNDLSLKRAEYADVIKNKGFDVLIEEILVKIEEMAQTGNN